MEMRNRISETDTPDMKRFLTILSLLCLLLPINSSAMVRPLPYATEAASFQSTSLQPQSEYVPIPIDSDCVVAGQKCRNDPVDFTDPLGLFSWAGFGCGVWDVVSEPFKAVSDTFILAPMVGINNLVSATDLTLDDIQFSSMLASGTRERRLAGDSGLLAVGKGYGELGLTVGTVGIYPLGKNLGESLGYYVEGDITLDELDYRLSRGAGGPTVAALAGVGASRAAGRGWTGRVLPQTKPPAPPVAHAGDAYLYRAVEKGSVHDIEASLQRTMTPRGGVATPEEVIRGINLESEYFPWTRSLDFAKRYGGRMYAERGCKIYRVRLTPRMQSVPAKDILPWNDPLLVEEEVLLKGIVHGIELLPEGQ